MTPVAFTPFSPITVGASPAPAGGTIFKPGAADFASKMAMNEGPAPIVLNGGVNPSASASQAITEPTNWGHLAQQMVRDVDAKQDVAALKVRDVLAGGPTPVHEALIASEEAGVSFQVLSEMRNKVLEAYQEVMRMSV